MWTQIWFCSSVSFVQTTSYRGNSSFQDLFIPWWEPSENHGEDIQVTVRLFGKTDFLPAVIKQLKEQIRMAGSWFREEILSQCVHDTDGSRAAMSRAASQKTNSSSRKMLQHVRELLHSSLSCVRGVQIKVVRDGSVSLLDGKRCNQYCWAISGESLSSIYLRDVRLSSSVIRNSFTHPLEQLFLCLCSLLNTLALELLQMF